MESLVEKNNLKNEGMLKAITYAGTQAELARMLKVDPKTVGGWTQGTRPVPFRYIKAIREITGKLISIEELYPKIKELY